MMTCIMASGDNLETSEDSMRYVHLVPLGILLSLSVVSRAATIPVIDVSAIAQLVTAYRTQVMQFAEQMQQTRNQVTQIQHEIEMISQGAQNLLTLDMNKAADLLRLTDLLQNKLNQAQALSYSAQRVVTQAQELYPQIQGVLDPAQQRALYLQWTMAQRDSARIALSTQAITTSTATYQRQWTDILNAARAAQGNMQIQQAQAQGLGVMGTQLQAIEQQLATQGRLQTQLVLEQAVRTETTVQGLAQASGEVTLTPGRGRLLHPSQ